MPLRRLCSGLALLVTLGSESSLPREPTDETGARRNGGDVQTIYHGGLVTPPLPKPKFTLKDTSGATFDFRSRTDGYVTLLFFGYSRCSSVCPAQMAGLGSAIRMMPSDLADRFKVVFVTLDPDRDNPRVLRTWLNQFDKTFIGLTGKKVEVEAAQAAARIAASKGDPANHAAFVLAYTKDNLAHVIYPDGVTQGDWLHDLPQLAQETWTDR